MVVAASTTIRVVRVLLIAAVLWGMSAGASFGIPAVQASSPDIVISQIYGGGGNTSAPLHNDFLELYNRGASAITVTGWSVQYAPASSTSWQVTALTGTINPGQYFLIQEAAGTGAGSALPTPDV